MEEEIKGANTEQETPPVETEEVESSTTEPQPEEATSQEAVEKEPPFHEHPRWQEMQDEKKELKETVTTLQQQIVDIAASRQTPEQKQDAVDELLASEDEETKKWVKNFLGPVVKQMVDKAKDEATKPLLDQIARSNSMVGEVIADRFLEKNPDIEKGSPEMKLVTQEAQNLAKYGMPIKQALEKAKRIVMFDKVGKKAVEKEKESIKKKNKQKEAANLETTSIPSQALSSKKPNESGEIQMDEFEEAARQTGTTF